eukprot:gene3109-3941_t
MRVQFTTQIQGMLEFQCGEVRKRTDSYLDKVSHRQGGKCMLNIHDVRGDPFFHTSPQLQIYHKAGPAKASPLTGVNSLRTTLPNIDSKSDLGMLLDDVSQTCQRLACINTMPIPLYGTERDGTLGDTGRMKLTKSFTPPGTLTSPIVKDYASLPPVTLTKAQQKKLRSLYRINPNAPPNYSLKRKRLKAVKVKSLYDFLGVCNRETLVTIVCLADWQPLCRKVLPVLEAINYEMEEKFEKEKAAKAEEWRNSGNETKPPEPHPSSVLVQVDVSESRFLQNKFNFKTVPMFLCYMEGHLVHISNTMTDRDQFQEQVNGATQAGKRGAYLPDDFKFKPGVTSQLNAILHCAI